ncbi:hypothetical protein SCAB_59883 [Streptomyces scabiei 87.22]|uniref:Uncharacterized protein n=1 Tax=Streptomyces scabiei (strain 87.22) TaxID=680198 RepID=C9Z7E4_STRSW|nr:hypothetical protein SCAB_59883 [Streptomyces scabiei 87.22]
MRFVVNRPSEGGQVGPPVHRGWSDG